MAGRLRYPAATLTSPTEGAVAPKKRRPAFAVRLALLIALIVLVVNYRTHINLGPIAWVLSTGLRQFGGRCAISLFGNGAELLTDGSRPLALVPGIKTGGATAFGGEAIGLRAEQLEFDNPRRPRFVYVISDLDQWVAGAVSGSDLR